jgi:hypothetical protein
MGNRFYRYIISVKPKVQEAKKTRTTSAYGLGENKISQLPFAATGRPKRACFLKFSRENIFETNFQFNQNRFQFVQSQMVLAMLNAKERLIRNTNFFGKLCIGKLASLLAKKFCQLLVEFALHDGTLAKISSRMRDVFALQSVLDAVR